MGHKRALVWDLPTRLFHWLLVAAVAGAVVTGLQGGAMMDWHGRFGLSIVGLLAFRLVWGFFGSTYARFAQFLPTPRKLATYSKGQWRGEGHNPLGALSVIGILGLLLVQVATGLISNDDIAFSGPLTDLVTASVSNRMTGVHHLLANVIFVVVGLHIGAVAFYTLFKRQSLVRPMFTGWKEDAQGESARGGGVGALIVSVALAAATVYGASGVWLAQPPPPAAGETPNF